MIANFMSQNISVNDELRKHRRDLNTRYPDPKKKDLEEASTAKEPASATKGKKDAKKEAAKKADPKKRDSKLETIEPPAESSPEKDVRSPSMSDSDSVIDDVEVDDFTNDLKHMRGAPLTEELEKILTDKTKGRTAFSSKAPEFLDNLSAKKTAY